MRSTTTTKTAFALLGGLALAGGLAACASPAATTDDGATTPDDAVSSGTYTDGTYTESGSYQAPSGTETVEVTITLADNVVTAVEVVGEATDPQAQQHQGEFADGIAAAVVGKNIDEIQVDKIGGSSLTSGGFTQALDTIKADAAA